MRLVLASTSRIRSELLTRAGLVFDSVRPEVDEPALKAAAKALSPGNLARSLAAAKAVSVANRLPEALVIGADQVLNLEGKAFDKPLSREEARQHLLAFSGHHQGPYHVKAATASDVPAQQRASRRDRGGYYTGRCRQS